MGGVGGCLNRSAIVLRAAGLAPTSGCHAVLDETVAGAGGPGALEYVGLPSAE